MLYWKRGDKMGVEIKSFAIQQADCFLIKIEQGEKYFNLLVDCGKTGLLDAIKVELGDKVLNGVVVTHVDSDHISGIIELLEKQQIKIINKKTFFLYNKYDESLISYEQGRKLYEQIKQYNKSKLLIKSYARNYNKENEVIQRRSKKIDLPVQLLSLTQRSLRERKDLKKDTVYITMLSPDVLILKKCMRKWSINQKSEEYQNRSSIVFLLEFNEKSILMLGDAMVSDVEKPLKQIKGLEKIDYIKISHHGAIDNNKGLADIASMYRCNKAAVTIKEAQDHEKTHPSRDLLDELKNAGCSIYTSTAYTCTGSDVISYIQIKDRIVV